MAEPLSQDRLVEIIHWRNRMYAIGWIGADAEGIGFGNISMRWSQDKFVISGTGTGVFREVSSSHFTLVTSFDPENNSLNCMGPVNASAESMTHGMIYLEDPSAYAVIHIHHPEYWKVLLGKVPTSDPKVPYGTPAMAYEMRRLFKEDNLASSKILAMGGHEDGIIGFGHTLEEAAAVLLGHARINGIV